MRNLLLIATLALLVPAAFGQATSDVLQEKFTFDGSSLQGDFRLQQDIQEPVYENKEVDSTCSREVPDGYETKCTTHYETQCRTEQRCHTYWDNECHTRYQYRCRTDYHNECRQEWRCPQRPGAQCRYEQVCHNRPVQRCDNYPVQECRSVPRQRCGYENVCTQVPRQDCQQVPKTKTEYYSCKKTIPVQVGTQRKLLITADSSIKFSQPPAGVKVAEEFVLKIQNEDLVLQLVKDSGTVLLFQNTNKTVETGTKLKAFRAAYEIDVVGIEALVSPIKAGVQDLRVDNDVLKFSVGHVSEPEFLVTNIELKRKKGLGSDPIVFSGDLKGTELLLTDLANGRTEVSIPLSNLAKNEGLKSATYKVGLTVKVGSLGKEPINKRSIPTVASSAAAEFKRP